MMPKKPLAVQAHRTDMQNPRLLSFIIEGTSWISHLDCTTPLPGPERGNRNSKGSCTIPCHANNKPDCLSAKHFQQRLHQQYTWIFCRYSKTCEQKSFLHPRFAAHLHSHNTYSWAEVCSSCWGAPHRLLDPYGKQWNLLEKNYHCLIKAKNSFWRSNWVS